MAKTRREQILAYLAHKDARPKRTFLRRTPLWDRLAWCLDKGNLLPDELAIWFEVAPGTLRTWLKRGSVPYGSPSKINLLYARLRTLEHLIKAKSCPQLPMAEGYGRKERELVVRKLKGKANRYQAVREANKTSAAETAAENESYFYRYGRDVDYV